MKLVRESLYNFNKTGDVKSGLKIGARVQISSWLDEMEIINYAINDDYSIDVNGDVNLSHKKIIEFPKYIKFGKIFGNFRISHSELISLNGFPDRVEKYFLVNNNNLKSLIGGPKYVGKDYICSNNEIENFNGIAEELGNLDIGNNKIRSLDGLNFPKNGYVSLILNPLESLNGFPEKFNGSIFISNTKIKNLKGAPRIVDNKFICNGNKELVSLDGIPEIVKGDFSIENCGRKFKEKEIRKKCSVWGEVFTYENS